MKAEEITRICKEKIMEVLSLRMEEESHRPYAAQPTDPPFLGIEYWLQPTEPPAPLEESPSVEIPRGPQ